MLILLQFCLKKSFFKSIFYTLCKQKKQEDLNEPNLVEALQVKFVQNKNIVRRILQFFTIFRDINRKGFVLII